jgi:hypothetical protein
VETAEEHAAWVAANTPVTAATPATDITPSAR